MIVRDITAILETIEQNNHAFIWNRDTDELYLDGKLLNVDIHDLIHCINANEMMELLNIRSLEHTSIYEIEMDDCRGWINKHMGENNNGK